MADWNITRLQKTPAAPSIAPSKAGAAAEQSGGDGAQSKTSDPVTISVARLRSQSGAEIDPNEVVNSLTEAILSDENALAAQGNLDAARVFDLLRDDDDLDS
jgi:hypothetical protein